MFQLLIQCIHLFKSFSSQQLFNDVSLSIHQGEIFALIGENGAGKTTLLQMLIGGIAPDSGAIRKATGVTVGFLPQEVIISSEVSVRAYMEEGVLSKLEEQMAACLEDPTRLEEWAKFHEDYENLGGYQRVPLEKIFRGLKLEIALFNEKMSKLSSGQKVRVALAKALMENPDLLLLDEPTNHLDQDMILWLEETIRLRQGATVIVSHDRDFLNKTCNRFIEINKGKLISYGGNYDSYLEAKKNTLVKAIQAYEAQEEEKAELKKKIKATTFSKKKAAPPSDSNTMSYDARGENHQKSLERNLDQWKARLEEIEKNPLKHPRPKSIIGLRFIPVELSTRVAVEIDHISKNFKEKKLFSGFNKCLCRGDRIVLRGINGSGKTTLLRCIGGIVEVDEGKMRCAPTAKIAYLDQEITLLPMGKTPVQYFEERFNLIEEVLRSELHKAAIGGIELLHRPFSTLSIGQRKRFMILSMILEKPNVLLLDEPTNHLDFMTLEAFETALLNFEGAILAVSHDRAFIKKVATAEWIL